MFCPTKDDTLAALLALLPRGRAWQNDDGGPEPYRVAAFDPNTFDAASFDATNSGGSVLYRFWEAVAYVVNYANERLCALALEMFCATQSETHDQWMTEYGLPDACDPFPDLCDKVAALGGSRCEYFNERIARLGWRARCIDFSERCGGTFGCIKMGARGAIFGHSSRLSLVIRVHTGDPVDLRTIVKHWRPAMFGRYQFGQRPSCDTITEPSISPVRCLMERIAPAHVQIRYVF